MEWTSCPFLSWASGWHAACPIPDMSGGCCHGTHCQSSTTFFVMEPRHCLLPHYLHRWTPGSPQCLFRVGTFMELFSIPGLRTPRGNGPWQWPTQADMGAVPGEDPGSSAAEPESLRACMSPPHEDQIAYATGRNGLLIYFWKNNKFRRKISKSWVWGY